MTMLSLVFTSVEGKKKTINIEDLLKLTDMDPNLGRTQVALQIEKDGRTLEAAAFMDPNYPGFEINGFGGKDGKDLFWLANAELPNETYPNDFVARLYAGASDFEVDSPIAMVRSNADGVAPNGKQHTCLDDLDKIVYVDTDVASMRRWKDCVEEMPEHVQD